MAKYIDTQFIAPGVAQPVKKGTLDLLQQAQQAGVSNILYAMIQSGDLSGISNESDYFEWNYYISLYGNGYSISLGTGNVDGGVILYQGQVYQSIKKTGITIPLGQTIVGTIIYNPTTATDADPVEFSDGTFNNVHINSTIEWAAGLAGSADIDIANLHYFGEWKKATYDAGNLLADAGTFTVASSADYLLKFKQIGKTVTIYFEVKNATTSLSTGNVILRIPTNAPFNGLFKDAMQNICSVYDANYRLGRIYADPGTRDLYIGRQDGVNMAATSGTFKIFGEITVEIE